MQFRFKNLALALVGLVAVGVSPASGACPANPDTACKFGGSSSFSYADSAESAKDKLSFAISKGSNTPLADFGDPTTTETYELCIYQGNNLTHSLVVAPDGDCTDDACWVQKTAGFSYKDKTLANGVAAMAVSTKADGSDSTKVKVKGKGDALPDIILPMVAPVVVQLRNSLGKCWSGAYRSENIVQDAVKGKFKAKTKGLPSCTDGLANGFEGDVDCGATCPSRCDFTSTCVAAADCASNVCNDGICDAKRAFITSVGIDGNMGGPPYGGAAANAFCTTRATVAGLGGTWSAFLSDDNDGIALFRIGDHGYKRLDGALVFESRSEIDLVGLPHNPLNIDEFGAVNNGFPWTGSNNTGGGTILPSNFCNNWTSVMTTGVYGDASTPGNWSYWQNGSCAVAHPLYCFEN